MSSFWTRQRILILIILGILAFPSLSTAQGTQSSLGFFRGGYDFFSSSSYNAGQFNFRYFLPFSIDRNTVAFGEARFGTGTLFFKESDSDSPYRSNEIEIRGDYLRRIAPMVFAGFEAAYLGARVSNIWISGWKGSALMYTRLSREDAIVLRATYFNNRYNPDENAAQSTANSYSGNIDYIYKMGPYRSYMKLTLGGYISDFLEDRIRGVTGRVSLTTLNGLVTLKALAGNDQLLGGFYQIGASLNLEL